MLLQLFQFSSEPDDDGLCFSGGAGRDLGPLCGGARRRTLSGMRTGGRRWVVAAVALVGLVPLAGCAKDEETPVAAVSTTTTTAPPLPDGACLARTKNPNPEQGGTETVIVDSHFPGLPVALTVHYKSKVSTFSGQLDARGHGETTFSIGHPTASFAVAVDVAVGDKETCQTSFTPR